MSEFDNIKNLFDELTKNPEKVDELSKDDIEALRRYNNPYGKSNRNDNTDGYCCVSITNLQQKFMEKMFMVAYTSFLFRVGDEYLIKEGYRYTDKNYVPKQNIKTELEDIIKPNNNAHLFNRSDDLIKEFNSNRFNSFRRYNNLYNKGIELKEKIIKENKKLKSYEKLVEDINSGFLRKRKIIENNNNLTDEEKIKEINNLRKLEIEEYKKSNVKGNMKNKYEAIAKLLDEMNAHIDTMHKYKENSVRKDINQFLRYNLEYNPEVHLKLDRDPIGNDKYRKSLSVDPKTKLPAKVFKNFQLYFEANYEEILKEVEALWAYKPELENTINVLEDGFKTKEEADKYIEDNKDRFTVQVHCVKKGSPYFLSAYGANVDKVKYYNENTEILEAIEKRVQKEQKVGEELLKHRVKRLRKERTDDMGKEDENAVKYLRQGKQDKDTKVLDEKEVLHLPVYTRSAKGLSKNTLHLEASEKVASTDPKQNNKSIVDVNKESNLEERKNKRLELSKMPE